MSNSEGIALAVIIILLFQIFWLLKTLVKSLDKGKEEFDILYPIYSKKDIERQKMEIEKVSNKIEMYKIEYDEKIKIQICDQCQKVKSEPNRDFEYSRLGLYELCENRATKENILRIMIEGNIEVINGGKIEDVSEKTLKRNNDFQRENFDYARKELLQLKDIIKKHGMCQCKKGSPNKEKTELKK